MCVQEESDNIKYECINGRSYFKRIEEVMADTIMYDKSLMGLM